jgi:anti-anti-sigma factor
MGVFPDGLRSALVEGSSRSSRLTEVTMSSASGKTGRDDDARNGELTHDTSAEVGRRLREVEASRPTPLVLDLRELRFMDSTGLGELVRAQQRARKGGCRLILVKREGPIERILAISGLAEELEMANDIPPNKTTWGGMPSLHVTDRADAVIG